MLAWRSCTWAWTWNRFMVGSLGGSAGGTGAGCDRARRAFAAVLGEVAEQGGHLPELGAVDQVAAGALHPDQAGMHQLLEVERQRAGRDAQALGHRPGREALRAGDD